MALILPFNNIRTRGDVLRFLKHKECIFTVREYATLTEINCSSNHECPEYRPGSGRTFGPKCLKKCELSSE